MDKNRHIFDHLSTLLSHVVIECPLMELKNFAVLFTRPLSFTHIELFVVRIETDPQVPHASQIFTNRFLIKFYLLALCAGKCMSDKSASHSRTTAETKCKRASRESQCPQFFFFCVERESASGQVMVILFLEFQVRGYKSF